METIRKKEEELAQLIGVAGTQGVDMQEEIDLGPLPKVHPRERLVTAAQDDVRAAIVTACKKYELTTAEVLQVIAAVLAKEVQLIAGGAVRRERHVENPTPEGAGS